jgi:hypothetical protein
LIFGLGGNQSAKSALRSAKLASLSPLENRATHKPPADLLSLHDDRTCRHPPHRFALADPAAASAIVGVDRSQHPLAGRRQRLARRDNNKKTIGFSNARLAYDDIIARLLFFLEAGTFAVKSTETLISLRFKERDEFDPSTISTASRSIELFSKSREQSSSIRLNKASALSWLLFFARFGSNVDPDFSFMSQFGNESGVFARHYIPEAKRVFQDRASLRVTDVSSVVYRDFALWYCYVLAIGAETPPSVDKGACVWIEQTLGQRSDSTFEYALSHLLNLEKWSKLS